MLTCVGTVTEKAGESDFNYQEFIFEGMWLRIEAYGPTSCIVYLVFLLVHQDGVRGNGGLPNANRQGYIF